jgi:ribosomal protein L29
MSKINDLRKEKTENLVKDLGEKRKEFIEKKIESQVNKSKDSSVFAKMRKEIAQIMTILKEKEVLNER